MMHVIYMLIYYVFGIMPWGFHLVNIVLHAGSSVLVFLIAGILFSEYKAPSKYLSIPLMAAVLFAVNPYTRRRSHGFRASRTSRTRFSACCHSISTSGPKQVQHGYYLSVVAFSIGTLCKEPAITLPALLLAYDMLLNKKKPGFQFIVKRYALFVLAASAYLGIRFYALGMSMILEATWRV